MSNTRKRDGFTIIETLVVVSIIVIVIALAGGISSKFAARRSVDDTAHRITSELNLIKLQAARDGVQYRTRVVYTEDAPKTIQIENIRGDSNRASNFALFQPQSTHTYKIMPNYEMDNTEYIIDFNPNGTAEQQLTLNFKPVDANVNISKCARIQVSQFGLIRTTIGRWEFETDTCEGIYQQQEEVGGSS